MSRAQKPWTAKERDWLRVVWGTMPATSIAARLGRSELAVRDAATRFGAQRRRNRRLDDCGRRIRNLHARGHTAKAIAARLGLSHAGLWAWLRRHGLRPNGLDPAVIRRVKQAEYRRVWKDRHLTQARTEVWAAHTAARGWPQARTPRQADVLDVLESGPKVGREIAQALGLCWCRGLGNPTLSELLRYLRAQGPIVSDRSREDRRQVIYRLADGVRRHVPERERSEGPVPAAKPRGEGVPVRVCRANAR